MKKKIAIVLFLLLICVFVAGAWRSAQHYVIHGFSLYSRDSQELTFFGQKFDQSDFEKLSQKLPQCRILWDVPFQEGTVPSDTQELTIESLTFGDLAQLSYLPELKRVHAEKCEDYPQLRAFIEARPDCEVTYQVCIDDVAYPQDADTVTVKHLTQEDLDRMQWLPELNTVKAQECCDYTQLRQLRQDHPEWKIHYWVTMGDTKLPQNAKSAYVEGATEQELLQGIPALTELTTLHLVNAQIDLTALEQLRKDYPDLDIRCEVSLGGNLYDMDCKEIRLEGTELESLEKLRSVAACLSELEKLTLVDCTVGGLPIENEALAALREEVRNDYKLIWKVYCGKVIAMTDDVWFMPIQQGEYYFQQEHAYNLRYCEDMVCIDVGHSRIKDVDFAAYMPHLKYLILTDTAVQDLSGLSSCKELVFLEISNSIVRDFSPLLGCTGLEDLNLDTLLYYPDMTPIYQLTWLKNLFIADVSSRVIYEAQEALPDTRVDYHGLSAQSGMSWRNLQNYYDMRDVLGMEYMM